MKLTISDQRRIVRMRRAGVSGAVIAAEYGVTRERIYQISRACLPHLHTRKRVIHRGATIARARRLWDQGLSAAQVAKKLKVTKNVISGIAHRNSFTARPSPIRYSA